jgi:hypothetical protein
MKKSLMLLIISLFLMPGIIRAQEEACEIREVKLVSSGPDKARFQVAYSIPPSFANPCFVSAYLPDMTKPDAGFRYDPEGFLPLGVPKGNVPFGDKTTFEVAYTGLQPVRTSTLEVIIYEKGRIICSKVFPLEKTWEPHGESPSGIILERILLVRSSEEMEKRDLDHDGLVDDLEDSLAAACHPYFVFDADEQAREPLEPVTLFQVRPLDVSNYANLRVRIRWVFLYRKDGGYGPDSWCKDGHAGDIETAWYDLASQDGGLSWDIVRIGLDDEGRLEWRPGKPGLETYGSHPVIRVSAGKHHQYFSSAYDHQNSVYSTWGCNEDVNGKGAFFIPDLQSVNKAMFNNVGEPEHHPFPPFIGSLDRIYPGQSVWGEKPFFSTSCGPIAREWMTFAWRGGIPEGYRLQSYAYPDLFIRHRRYLGELTKLYSTIEKQSATFMILPGLADSTVVSFEAINYPGYYLRAEDARIKLQKLTDDKDFGKDATFRMVPGLADKTWTSFESFSKPGNFMRQRDLHLYLEKGDDEQFRKDATFRIIPPK